MVMEVVQEDIEEDSMQCAIHPLKNNTPGAICAFCLQEKLGNLVSSAFSVAIFPSSPSPPLSPYPETASNCISAATNTTIISSAITLHHSASTHSNQIFTRRATLPFMLAQRINKKKTKNGDIAIRRCNSTTTPRQGVHFVDHSAKKRGFWSFLYSTSSYSSSRHTIAKKINKTCRDLGFITSSSSTSTNMSNVATGSSRERKTEENMVVEEHDISTNKGGSGTKVSRSRSVGCGSRSFSSDFFGRISTGLGDCTLLRVESQREVKAKNGLHKTGDQDCINERVRCGGIFGSFMINNSSSSSSSSIEDHTLYKKTPANAGHHNNQGQATTSLMRSLSSKDSNNKKAAQQKNNVAPNLTLIPDLHAGRS
ncbi:hypothetical protein LIER_37190 [Lithospermum erythrorhizon]|uniref:Uncharacterized protein n=1 Tax=Lithospermum erythrorhizon TaxID=34254 RepID=A0AAV3PIB9_LITER